MLRTIILTVLSACLLVVAYPQLGWHWLAWIAFVPLFFILDGKCYKNSFGTAYLFGFAFFFGTLGWFIYVTYPGAFLLIAYIAVYFGLFGLAFKFFQPLPLVGRLLILPSVWVVLEWVRSWMFTGFGWAMLGHSQYQNTLLIQIADVSGVYGVSFLVMMVNVLIYETLRDREPLSIRRAQVWTLGLLLLSLGYGAWVGSRTPQWPTVNVGVVQPNIPQELKWEPHLQWWIVQKTIHMSQELAKAKPDLIVWPETALPGILSEVPALLKDIQAAARDMHTPFLIGAITQEGTRYYNSAYLITAKGELTTRYDKIHLVPFGEYLPLRPLLGWVNNFVPLEDFTSGKDRTLFEAGCAAKRFGTLICFEDTLGYLHREFADAGAGFMVNMTNDAWFKDTKAPYIHLQAAVFGSVANKRALVRAANTGFSGFIDPYGRIITAAHDDDGKKTFVSAVAVARIPVVTEKTFYTKYGDIFTYLCLFAILWAVPNRRKYV